MAATPCSEVQVRITVRRPPAAVAFAIQRGRDELVAPTDRSARTLVFNFVVGLAPVATGKGFALRGPYVQGPAANRFIYLNSGARAGQPESPWNRRAKLPLGGISPSMIAAILRSPYARLEATVNGTAPDGGPVCASITPVEWQVTESRAKSRQLSNER